jgi:hypothetical protein
MDNYSILSFSGGEKNFDTLNCWPLPGSLDLFSYFYYFSYQIMRKEDGFGRCLFPGVVYPRAFKNVFFPGAGGFAFGGGPIPWINSVSGCIFKMNLPCSEGRLL